MVITITSGTYSEDMRERVHDFLEDLVKRLADSPGVVEVLQFTRSPGESVMIVVWEDRDAFQRYREGPLLSEVLAFEKEVGARLNRQGPYEVQRWV